jgi:hypothetical protein
MYIKYQCPENVTLELRPPFTPLGRGTQKHIPLFYFKDVGNYWI